MLTVSEQPVARPQVTGVTAALGGHVTLYLLLLAGLVAAVGLGRSGLLAGAAYAAVLWVLLASGLRRSGARALGPANHVTLARALLTGAVTALATDAALGGGSAAAHTALVVLAAVALALDGVDGQVARRTGTSTRLGARFDMEVDSVLVLVLAMLVAPAVGWWVLAVGLARYAFAAAAVAAPWLRAPLPHRMSRKTVAAAQGIVLVVAAAGVLPGWLAGAVVGSALAALVWSFGRDTAWLWRSRPRAFRVGTPPASPHGAAPVPGTRVAAGSRRPPHHVRLGPGGRRAGAARAGRSGWPVRRASLMRWGSVTTTPGSTRSN